MSVIQQGIIALEKYKNPSKLLISDDFKNFVYDLKSDFPNSKIVIGGAGLAELCSEIYQWFINFGIW